MIDDEVHRGTRKQRRAAASRAVNEAKCNACGKVVFRMRTKRNETNPERWQRQARAAIATHLLKTGCRKVLEADRNAGKTLEMTCGACGVIVLTMPMSEAVDQKATEVKAMAALRAHMADTFCSGEQDKRKATPKRRDPRCEAPDHVEGCRCDKTAPELEMVETGGSKEIG
jgi:hypothetical protein